jgi:hypothetical protein
LQTLTEALQVHAAGIGEETNQAAKNKQINTKQMKKYIISGITVLAIVAVSTINSTLSNGKINTLSDLQLANVEALASGEALPYESIGCNTVSCDADPNPNRVTPSVRRTCYVLNNGQYSSCREVPCGEVFYGCN